MAVHAPGDQKLTQKCVVLSLFFKNIDFNNHVVQPRLNIVHIVNQQGLNGT